MGDNLVHFFFCMNWKNVWLWLKKTWGKQVRKLSKLSLFGGCGGPEKDQGVLRKLKNLVIGQSKLSLRHISLLGTMIFSCRFLTGADGVFITLVGAGVWKQLLVEWNPLAAPWPKALLFFFFVKIWARFSFSRFKRMSRALLVILVTIL